MKKKLLIAQTTAHFESWAGQQPEMVFLSPGRVNIIGEHVDYNDGFVLPAAINKYICFAVSANETTECCLNAKDLDDTYVFDLNDDLKPVNKTWVNYMLGVISQIKDRGLLTKGFNITFSSTIPMGAGLSSSAALECGTAYILSTMFNLNLSKEDIAVMGQKAEHEFVGVKCGIMDQFASVFGKKKHVIQLDCTSLDYEYHRADFSKYKLLLLDSHVKHTHLTSGYNTRREEVEAGLAIIKLHFPFVKTFRDCTTQIVESVRDELGDVRFRRCNFVVREIKRVRDAVAALDKNELETVGQLMYETHAGLQNDYEISCPELDFLVDQTRNDPKVIGARMMGGGFGGCSINLVEKGYEKQLIARIADAYKNTFGIELSAYKVKIANGTSLYQKSHESIQ